MKEIKKFFKDVFDVIKEMWITFARTIDKGLYKVAVLIEMLIPYIAMYLVYQGYKERGNFYIGGEFFIPIVMLALVALVKKVANKRGNGNTFPVPYKKFTQDMGDGEITINQDDIQDIILYLDNVERFLYRTGKMNK